MLRKSRPLQVGVCALMLAIPGSAVALTAGQANAQSATTRVTLDHHHISFGRSLNIVGTTTPNASGQALALQFAVPHGAWRTLATTRVGRHGHFRFTPLLRQSGLVRVVATAAPVASRNVVPPAAAGPVTLVPSTPQRVSVAARFAVPSNDFTVLGGQGVDVRGKLLPAAAGRRIELVSSGSNWHAVSAARTGPHGGFELRYTPGGLGQQWLHVQFAGDRRNAGTWGRAGQVTVFRPSLASWFTDGGATACGFHAYYGVANKSLPCGTKVTFRYGGRSVTATVEDRGPYVGGREWDLNQNTAAALGFDGVGTVWSSQ